MKTYYIYILGSRTGTLYTGITSRLRTRVFEHKTKRHAGFTAEYNVERLLYVETFGTAARAISREKQIKGYRREKKVNLIDSMNPQWNDLSEGWYEGVIPTAEARPVIPNGSSEAERNE